MSEKERMCREEVYVQCGVRKCDKKRQNSENNKNRETTKTTTRKKIAT